MKIIKTALIILILFLCFAFFITRGVEKVVVPNHIDLKEDKYIIIHEKRIDSSYKEVYYKLK